MYGNFRSPRLSTTEKTLGGLAGRMRDHCVTVHPAGWASHGMGETSPSASENLPDNILLSIRKPVGEDAYTFNNAFKHDGHWYTDQRKPKQLTVSEAIQRIRNSSGTSIMRRSYSTRTDYPNSPSTSTRMRPTGSKKPPTALNGRNDEHQSGRLPVLRQPDTNRPTPSVRQIRHRAPLTEPASCRRIRSSSPRRTSTQKRSPVAGANARASPTESPTLPPAAHTTQSSAGTNPRTTPAILRRYHRRKYAPARRTLMPKEPYRLEDNIGFLLRVCQQKSVAVFNQYAPEGLSSPRFAALAALVEAGGPVAQNRLGRLIATDAATIKGIVDRLKRLSAVDTSANPADRRQRLVSVTPVGREMYERGVAASVESSRAMFEDLSREESDMLRRLLRRVGNVSLHQHSTKFETCRQSVRKIDVTTQ